MPRLLAAEADRNEVFIHGPATGPAGERLSDLDQDLSRLKAQMDALGGVSLIIIDPITAYLGKKDANKIGDVRGILAKLAQLAEILPHMRSGDQPLEQGWSQESRLSCYRISGLFSGSTNGLHDRQGCIGP